jgi:hypothetical protein
MFFCTASVFFAIAIANDRKEKKISANNVQRPANYVPVQPPVRTAPPAYNPTVTPNTSSGNGDHLEQLRKFKIMLDEGLITQEDYDEKKAEILKSPAPLVEYSIGVTSGEKFFSLAVGESGQNDA